MANPQYDAIGATYTMMKQLPTARIESSNLHAAVAPHVGGARVLDLACGTGYYSRLLLDWGATSVVGIDLSAAMIAAAEHEAAQSLDPSVRSRLRFQVGDAATLGRLEDTDSGAGFNLVVGAWLLNYARDEDELAGMFATISANLNGPGAIFAGITPPPVACKDLDAFAARINDETLEQRRRRLIRVSQRYYERMTSENGDTPNGWRVEVAALDAQGKPAVVFRNYHLPIEVYERAARRGGMHGTIQWKEITLQDSIREQAIREFGQEFWREYFDDLGPHFGLLVVAKGN
ncbi:Methyltransferase domain-containing protein [Madurella fahalii]|uniref:Methyltransferase domain-containing protein n=1 Tax=Madurella fahalii TaxID=1157608 RepID=A0ABQ0GQJ6_9PEZI